MKSQSLSQSQSESAQTTHISEMNTELSQQNEKCSQKGLKKHACITRSCPNYAFLCENQNCPCQSLHEDCIIVKKQQITKNLKKKIISVQPLENIINQNVDLLIDLLSQNRDNILSDIKQKLQFLGLTEWEKDLLKALTSNEKLDASGHQLWQMHRMLTVSSSIVDESLANIDEQFKLLKSEISIKFTQVKNKLNQLLSQTLTNLKNQEDILSEAYNKCIKQQSAFSLKYKNINKLSKNQRLCNKTKFRKYQISLSQENQNHQNYFFVLLKIILEYQNFMRTVNCLQILSLFARHSLTKKLKDLLVLIGRRARKTGKQMKKACLLYFHQQTMINSCQKINKTPYFLVCNLDRLLDLIFAFVIRQT